MFADERLGPELAEEGVHHPGQVDPEDSGQAAEAAVGAAVDAAHSARWGRQLMLAARAGELGPVTSEELVWRRFLGGNRQQVRSRSLLHEPVLNRETVAAPPDYRQVIVIGFLLGFPVLRPLPLLLHGTAWPACGQQVPETRIREMAILIVEMGELRGLTQAGFPWRGHVHVQKAAPRCHLPGLTPAEQR